jgi:signal transduction histidine kinase
MNATPIDSTVSGPGMPATIAPSPAPARQMALTLTALAHDLRTPLTVIRASAQVLDRYLQAADGTPVVVAEHAGLIIHATARLASMTDHLHELAQAAARHQPVIDRRPTDLAALARAVADEHALLWGGRAITVTSETAEVMGAWDAGKLARVIANLLANALKYSVAGTPVRVTVGREGDAWARLEVSDAGIGIPAADLPHVFTLFFRGANAAGQAAGTGIGLASVRTIVEQHGGTVAVASVEGRGTTVTVRLPLHPLDGA